MSDKAKLASFIKALEVAKIMKFDKNRFNHRLKLQKYAYIAGNYGLRTNYDYSLYIHGPYSSKLADDYYRIEDFGDSKPSMLDPEFIDLVYNKSERWLELAATIIMIKKRYPTIDSDDLIDLTRKTKQFATEKELRSIMQQLLKHKCIIGT